MKTRKPKPKPKFKRFFRKQDCYFCVEKIEDIDYKDLAMLRRFLSDRGKLRPRRSSGNCARHQRLVVKNVKRARIMALLPFSVEHYR